MPIPANLAGFALENAGEAVAFGAGFALGRILEPVGVTLAQEAWDADPSRALDAMVAAEIAAESVDAYDRMQGEAQKHGIDGDRFRDLYGVSLTAPGTGELLRALRRSTLSEDDVRHGFRKAKREERWDAALLDLQHERLDPSAIATAIHRGIIAGQGLIVTEPPQGAGRVPHVPQSSLDAVAEARAQGYDAERLRILVGNTGLPLALGEMLQLLNRGQVTEDDVRRAVAQSNIRNEYMDVALGLRRRLLTPHEYAEAHLRGWIGEQEMLDGAGLSGMTDADTTLLSRLLGRPLSFRQAYIGIRRGGVYDGPTGDIDPAFLHSLRQSNVRPEWYNLAWAQRYSYPSAFVLRSLAQAGELGDTQAVERILLEIGWPPSLAAKVAPSWQPTGAKADAHVGKAEAQLWTALHKSYVDGLTDDTQAQADLATLGVAASAAPEVLRLWNAEREIVRRALTPSQIKKAYHETKYTRDEALAYLERLGMSPADAATLLDE